MKFKQKQINKFYITEETDQQFTKYVLLHGIFKYEVRENGSFNLYHVPD